MGVEETACDAPKVSTDPSAIPVNVRNVCVVGLHRTQNALVTNQLKRLFNVKTFDKLNEELSTCNLKLARLGVFKNHDQWITTTSDSDNIGDVDVMFKVEEYQGVHWLPFLSTAGVGAEASPDGTDGSCNLHAKLVNFWSGLGETMKVSMSRGTSTKSSYDFTYRKPWVENSDCVFTLNMLRSITEFPSSFYKETANGVDANFSLPGTLGVYTLGWNLRWRENTIVSHAPFDIREQCGHSLKSSFCHSFVSDGRNDWIIPSLGHYYRHVLEYSGVGGDVNALKGEVEVQLNKELFTDCILSASFRASAIKSLSDAALQINERTFLGGPNSIRGFAVNGVGDHAGEASLGGEVSWESGIHLYTPLPWVRNKLSYANIFRLHLFANAGNLWESVENIKSWRDVIEKPRTSCGLGLTCRFFGLYRLELNYCVPLNVQPGDVVNRGIRVGFGINFL